MTLVTLSAHDIITTKLTFTRDVSRIFVRRCVACHSSSSSIPLTTYEEARPWAVAIKEQVLSRQMPPWGAVKGFGNLSPDHGLTQEEILLIAAWVIGGSPKGNPALLPPLAPALVGPRQMERLKDGPIVATRLKVKAPMSVVAIRPLQKERIESTRITVRYPDGHIEPLLWLYQYQPGWQQTFYFRDPMPLPAGSIIECTSPLTFSLKLAR